MGNIKNIKIFFVRHGQTDWNVQGRFQGRIDTPLNKKGAAQAQSVAVRLKEINFGAIISSPLARAYKTAEAIKIMCAHSSPIIKNEGVTEINHGLWEGCFSSEIEDRWGQLLKDWHEKPHTVTMPGEGGESLVDVRERAVRAMNEIENKYAQSEQNSQNILIASHDAVLKVLMCHYTGAPIASFWRFVIPNAGISVVETDGVNPKLLLFGDASHWQEGFEREEQKGL